MRVLPVFAFVLAAACSRGGTSSEAPTDLPPEARIEAAKIFETRCVPCHGAVGHGDGPASASLNPKPRRFADKDWQSSVTNDHLERIIQYGGGAVGKSAAMPANPDLQSKPFVVKALVAKIRGFGG